MRVNALFQIALGISMSRSLPDRSISDLQVTLDAVHDIQHELTGTLASSRRGVGGASPHLAHNGNQDRGLMCPAFP